MGRRAEDAPGDLRTQGQKIMKRFASYITGANYLVDGGETAW
jgi:hypothetical protein